MKILKQILRNSSHADAADMLRQLSARRKKNGSVLLVTATKQIAQGDVVSARRTVERFELVAKRLSKDETAQLQSIKDCLAR